MRPARVRRIGGLLIVSMLIAWLGSPFRAAGATGYLLVAEGRSSASAQGPSQVAYRVFSAPAHAPAVTVATLTIEPRAVLLVAGEAWPLSSLRVVAFDSSGKVVPGVPFTVELDEATALMIDTGALYESSELLATGSGFSGQLRVRALSEPGGTGAPAAAVVPVHVSAPHESEHR